MKKTILFALLAGMLALSLAACTPTTTPSQPDPTALAGSPVGSAGLTGTNWALLSYGAAGSETPLVAGSNVNLKFEADGLVSGSAGCNSYGGAYQLDGDQIRFGEIMSTLIGCVDNAITQQEAVYLMALRSSSRLVQAGDDLQIFYDGGDSVLNFTRIP